MKMYIDVNHRRTGLVLYITCMYPGISNKICACLVDDIGFVKVHNS